MVRQKMRAGMSTISKCVSQPLEVGVSWRIHPYHRAPHLLIGFLVRYVDRAGAPSISPSDGSDRAGPDRIRNWPASLRALPDFEQRLARAALSERLAAP